MDSLSYTNTGPTPEQMTCDFGLDDPILPGPETSDAQANLARHFDFGLDDNLAAMECDESLKKDFGFDAPPEVLHLLAQVSAAPLPDSPLPPGNQGPFGNPGRT
jgi:hypothetical protein